MREIETDTIGFVFQKKLPSQSHSFVFQLAYGFFQRISFMLKLGEVLEEPFTKMTFSKPKSRRRQMGFGMPRNGAH